MASYIDWYLVELERRISGKLPPEHVFTAMAEVGEHLALKAEELQAAGMSQAQSEKAAIGGFGTPRSLAFGLLEGRRVGKVSEIAGRICTLASTLFVLLTATAVCQLGFWESSINWIFCAIVGSVVLMLIPALLTRRVQTRLILICAIPCATISGIALSKDYLLDGLPLPRDSVVARRGLLAYEEKDLSSVASFLDEGAVAYRQMGDPGSAAIGARHAPQTSHGEMIVLPSLGSWYGNPEQLGLRRSEMSSPYPQFLGLGVITTTDLQVARDSWEQNEPMLMAQTRVRLANRERTISEADGLLSHPVGHSAALFALGFGVTLLLAVAVWLGNLAAMQFARLLRWVLTTRPRLAL